jgi:hypothetical protein
MNRPTIARTKPQYRASKQPPSKPGKTVGLIAERVRRARANSNLDEARALKLAVAESRAARRP